MSESYRRVLTNQNICSLMFVPFQDELQYMYDGIEGQCTPVTRNILTMQIYVKEQEREGLTES